MENSQPNRELDHFKTFAKIVEHGKWRNGYLRCDLAPRLNKTGKIDWQYVDKLNEKEAKEILCYVD